MNRRKAAALASAKSTSAADSISAEKDTGSTNTDLAPIIQQPTRNIGGNVQLELGDETLDDNEFAAMLEQYNNSVTQATPAAANDIIESLPPVIYDEPREEAQNDSNFYSSMHNFDPFMTDDELSNELNLWDMIQ